MRATCDSNLEDQYFIVPGYLLDQVFDPTGAGDCFCGATLARLAAGDSIWDAARYGNAHPSIVATYLLAGSGVKLRAIRPRTERPFLPGIDRVCASL